MILYFTINSPHQWVRLDSKGVHDSGQASELSELPEAESCVAVVPGEQVVTRTETLPVKSRQKLLAAIPYAIEDSLVSPVDQLHFSVLHSGPENRVTFAYVDRGVMSQWLGQLNEAGLNVVSLLPDYLLLPGAVNGTAVITSAGDNRIAIRSGQYRGVITSPGAFGNWLESLEEGSSIIADKHLADSLPDEFLARETPAITTTEIGDKLADWLEQEKPQQGPGLLSGEYSRQGTTGGWRRLWPAAAIILLAGLLRFGSDVTELAWLQNSTTELDRDMQSLYQEMFPGSRLLPGRARVQTASKLQELQGAAGADDFVYLLVTASGLLQNQRTNIEELDYRNGKLTTVLTLDDFAHMDRVRKQLQEDPSISVTVKQSGARGNKVRARFEITRSVT